MYFEVEKSQQAPAEAVENDTPAADPVVEQADAGQAEHDVAPTEPPAERAETDVERAEPDAEQAEPEVEQPEPAAEPPLAGAPEVLLPALQKRGFEQLTDVQRAVADADDGARDLRISSRTGSGKTVALGFALLDRLVADNRNGPTTLVIAPTRELAMQVKEELTWLFADLRGSNCEVVTGGTNLDRERMRLSRRPAVLVGTPGRLLDHVRRGNLDLSSVSQLVLDEADQMLDLGFKDELDGILEHLPEGRRTHLVSATFPPAVLELANRFQDDALEIAATAPGEAHDDIEHIACRVQKNEHYRAVVNLLLMAGDDRTLIFVRTREDTTRLADQLAADGFGALPLNGDLAQGQRTRTLGAFKNGAIRTLVATDVAARGIDVPSVTMVIHVDLPIDGATYVHRSGRTGRAGQKGRSVMLVPKSRAGRTERLFRHVGIQPRWTWAPTAEAIRNKQLGRAEQATLARLTGAPAASPELRSAAASLLRERDPVEVVACLLEQTVDAVRQPFDLQPPKRPEAPPEPTHRRADRDRPPHPRRDPVEPGFVRFRINWGTRDGANPRRILAHVCRRGDIGSRLIGSIEMTPNASTFEVAGAVAESFSRRVQRPDRRDPHLVIHRDEHAPHGRHDMSGGYRDAPGGYRGAIRTRQSR